MNLEYNVNFNKYKTIKEVLKKHFHISDRLLLKLKRNNRIIINNTPSFINKTININDKITIDISFNEISKNILPVQMDLNIIYEDDSFLILNKPPKIPVHPSMSHFENSLSNGVQYYYNSKKTITKIRPINRLDKDTSGLVIFAKNEYIQECLIKQMKNNSFEKYYLAILDGNLQNNYGTINKPIGRKDGSIIEREIRTDGQLSITHYKLIKNYNKYCLVEFKLETGRTHQIRVHSKYINHPILNDTLYGSPSKLIERQALHAYKIKFIHPITNKEILLEIPVSSDIQKLI